MLLYQYRHNWSSSGGQTSETEPCGQAVVNFLNMQMQSSVKLPAGFFSFALQMCKKLSHPNTCGYIQVSKLNINSRYANMFDVKKQMFGESFGGTIICWFGVFCL